VLFLLVSVLLLKGKCNSGIENIILPDLTVAPVERKGLRIWCIQFERTVMGRFCNFTTNTCLYFFHVACIVYT
jgi:hypothetical protein